MRLIMPIGPKKTTIWSGTRTYTDELPGCSRSGPRSDHAPASRGYEILYVPPTMSSRLPRKRPLAVEGVDDCSPHRKTISTTIKCWHARQSATRFFETAGARQRSCFAPVPWWIKDSSGDHPQPPAFTSPWSKIRLPTRESKEIFNYRKRMIYTGARSRSRSVCRAASVYGVETDAGTG